MENLQIAQILELSPYGALLFFLFLLYRFFVSQYWPFYQKAESVRQDCMQKSLEKLQELHAVILNDRIFTKDQHLQILKKLDTVENLILQLERK